MRFFFKTVVLIVLFQLAFGIGLLFDMVLRSVTLQGYVYAVLHWADIVDQVISVEQTEHEQLEVQLSDKITEAKMPQVPLVSLHHDSALNSFPFFPPAPMDYAVLLRNLYEHGARNVYVVSPMSWHDAPDMVVQHGVGEELARFQHSAVGREMLESARSSTMPHDWHALIVPPENIQCNTDLFPRADRLLGGALHVLPSPRLIGTVVENNDLSNHELTSNCSYPLFVRWGGEIVPTLPVVAALDILNLTMADIYLNEHSILQLGDFCRLPLDPYARIQIAVTNEPILLDTQEVIYPRVDGLPLPDTTRLDHLLQTTPAVLISEPTTHVQQPSQQATILARTISAILATPTQTAVIHIEKTPFWIQWLIVQDVLLLLLLSYRFTRIIRSFIWGVCLLGVVVLAWVLLQMYYLWLPIAVPIMAGIVLIAFIAYSNYIKPEEEQEVDGLPDSEQQLPSHGTGTGQVLPQEQTYQELNTVPIPHGKRADTN